MSQVEFMGKATPFQRLKLWAFSKEWTLPVRGAPNGAWFEKYNHARAAVRLAKFAVVPKDVALAGCDFLWTVKGTLPTVAALSRLFYSQRCEYVRQQEQRFLAITQEWRDGQSTFVPLLDEQVTPMQLARILSPQLLPIPFTCFDRDRPEESAAPHHSILRWLARIPEQRFRDALTLLAAIQAANGRAQHSVESFLRGLHSRLQEIRAEVPEFEPFASRPDDVLRRVWEGEACKGMSPDSRNRLPLLWNNAARIFEVYAKKLNGVDRDRLFDFAFKLLQDHYYWRNQKPTEIINLMQKRRRKEKVDGITQKFYELRFDADVRFNICGRLRENCLRAIERAKSGEVTPPYDFSYSERVTGASRRHAISQTVKLRLHSASSLVQRFRDSGISFPRSTLWATDPGHHEKYEEYFVEYLGAESKDAGSGSQPFWFIDIFRHRLYSDNLQQDEKALKERILTSNGYPTNEAFRLPGGLLTYSPSVTTGGRNTQWLMLRARAEWGTVFLPFEEIYAAALYGRALFRVQSITGARIGEILQANASKGGLREEIIPLSNGKTKSLYVFQAIPKGGQKEVADFYIDRETMEHFVAVGAYARISAGLTDPNAPLPIVNGYLKAKVGPNRYIFQIGGNIVDTVGANALYRFLFWGIVKGIETHSIRHAVANQLDRLGVPHEVIAKLLNQKDLATTAYYKEPTRHQIIKASELLFVETVDWNVRPSGASKKTAQEHAAFLNVLAEGQQIAGVLTEVTGGFCTVMKSCVAQFSCVNCAGKVPDPSKRDQVITKRAEAERRLEWASSQGLLHEEKQARLAVSDCHAELDEMDLIEAARADAAQLVTYSGGQESR